MSMRLGGPGASSWQPRLDYLAQCEAARTNLSDINSRCP